MMTFATTNAADFTTRALVSGGHSACHNRAVRVLVTSPGGIGHATPLVPLAIALVAAGAEVRVACPSPAAERLVQVGLDVTRIGMPGGDANATCLERFPEIRTMLGSQLPGFVFPRLFGEITAAAQFPDLLAIARSWRPHLVVHDAADLAAPVVAAAVGVPNVCHGFGTVVPATTMAAAAERAAALWETVGLEPRPFGGCYDHLYVDPFPPSLQPVRSEHLGRVVAEAPQAAAAAPGESLPEPVEAALADGAPLVHVTFGTVYNRNAAFDAAVAAAARLDAVVLVTVGPGGDVTAFGQPGANVHIERFVAQSLVMPRAAALASHAGSGTVLAALQHAVPQVCIPQAADQFRNAAAVDASGAGTAITDDATPEAIDAALRRLLDDPAIRAAASAMASEIAAMPTADEVAIEVLGVAGSPVSS